MNRNPGVLLNSRIIIHYGDVLYVSKAKRIKFKCFHLKDAMRKQEHSTWFRWYIKARDLAQWQSTRYKALGLIPSITEKKSKQTNKEGRQTQRQGGLGGSWRDGSVIRAHTAALPGSESGSSQRPIITTSPGIANMSSLQTPGITYVYHRQTCTCS